MIRQFGRTYAIALAAFGAIGIAALLVGVIIATLARSNGGARPTIEPSAGYTLQYRLTPSGAMTDLQVDANGDACSVLHASTRLYTACVLTTNLDAPTIASQAFGEINTSDTAALEALMWRARILQSASFCEQGGLLGVTLDRCHQAVQVPSYAVTDGDITVAISLGDKRP